MIVKLLTEHHLEFKLKRRLHRLIRVYTCQNATLLEISCHGSNWFSFILLQVVKLIPDILRAASLSLGTDQIKPGKKVVLER